MQKTWGRGRQAGREAGIPVLFLGSGPHCLSVEHSEIAPTRVRTSLGFPDPTADVGNMVTGIQPCSCPHWRGALTKDESTHWSRARREPVPVGGADAGEEGRLQGRGAGVLAWTHRSIPTANSLRPPRQEFYITAANTSQGIKIRRVERIPEPNLFPE